MKTGFSLHLARIAGLSAIALAFVFAAPDKGALAQDAADSETQASYALDVITVSARKREERLIDTPVAATALSKVQLERYNVTSFAQLTTQLTGVNIYQASGGGAGGNMQIRGVGRQGSDYGQEQPVALVVDGFSFTRGHILDLAFFDIESINVLKGPQTLFFGKNSPAGVISVETTSPGDEFGGYARASYEFRQENPVVEFGADLPVNDKLKIRIAGRGQFMQGGFLKFSTDPDINRDLGPFETDALYPSVGPANRKFPEQRQYVARLTALFEPTDDFDALLKFTFSRNRQNDAGRTVLYACADGPGSSPWLSTAFFGLVQDTGQTCPDKFGKVKLERPTAQQPTAIHEANPTLGGRDNEYFQRTRNVLITLEMNWDLGDITLTSVSGFWDYNQDEYTNYDYTSFAVVSSLQGESGQSWTTEFRVQSDFDFPVNFMAGVFYEDMTRDLRAPVQIFPLGPAPDTPFVPDFYEGSFLTYDHFWDNWIESVSAFAEVRWDITDQLELSGGIRYTDESRDTEGIQYFNRLDNFFANLMFPQGNPFAPAGSTATLNREFDDWSPSATLTWKPTDDLMTFVAYRTGFQAAGTSNPGTFGNFFNFVCPDGFDQNPDVMVNDQGNCKLTEEGINNALTFDGSEVEGFEIGVKGQFLDGRMRAELIAWRYIYDDLQVAVFNSDTTTFTIQNAAKAVNKGLEGSLTFQATQDLQVRLSGQYVFQKYKDYDNAQCYAGQNVPGASNYVPELAALCTFDPTIGDVTQDMSGERFGNGPFQIKAGFTWDRPVSNSWNIALSGDIIHKQKGKQFLRQPNTAVPSYTVFDLAVRMYQSAGPWEVSLICSNCGNEKYVVSIQDKPLQKIGDLTGQIADPRFVTIQGTYRW